jgi:hypothetical protein
MTGDTDTWDASDVVFNPTATANSTFGSDYSTIPQMTGMSAGDDNVATRRHTDEYISQGLGDICKLVGLSEAQAKALAAAGRLDEYDSGLRLPRFSEQSFYNSRNFLESSTGGITQQNLPGTEGRGLVNRNTMLPDNRTYLPVRGQRIRAGDPFMSGVYGAYWTSSMGYISPNGSDGVFLAFMATGITGNGIVDPGMNAGTAMGQSGSVRCVPNNHVTPELMRVTIQSANPEMGSVSITAYTGLPGERFEVTVAPAPGYKFSGWSSSAKYVIENEKWKPATTGLENPVYHVVDGRNSNVTAQFAKAADGGNAGILYFDAQNRLSIGHWLLDRNIKVSNMAFFKFGSVIGFDNNRVGDPDTGSVTWPSNGSAIKFNPTTLQYGAGKDIEGYAPSTYNAATSNALPYIPGWVMGDPRELTTGAGYVSVANLKAGKGDPCMLVGFTGAELAAMSDSQLQAVLGSAKYRLPTSDEWYQFEGGVGAANGYVGYVIKDADWQSYWNFNSSTVADPPTLSLPIVDTEKTLAGTYMLPAAGKRVGRRSNPGEVFEDNNRGMQGYYWEGSMYGSEGQARYTYFYNNGSFNLGQPTDTSDGCAIRCIPR